MDTYYIASIYRARPSSMLDMGFGEWFCRGMNISNKELFYEMSVEKCKLLILENKYNDSYYDILQLKEFNNKGKKE